MKRKQSTEKIDAVRHKDKRKNIPTEELRDFVRAEEQQPAKVRYPRDPDLDPQLVWKARGGQSPKTTNVPRGGNACAWGRWAFVEISDPWDAKAIVRSAVCS